MAAGEASGRVILLSEHAQIRRLYPRTFISMVSSFLPNIFMWKTIAHGCASAVRRQPARPMTAISAIAPVLLPSSTQEALLDGQAAAVELHDASELGQTTADEIVVHVLAQLDNASAVHGSQPPKIIPKKPIGFSEKKENDQGR